MIERIPAGIRARPLMAAVFVVLAVAVAALLREHTYHPLLIIETGAELRTTILQQGRPDREKCMSDAAAYAAAIKASCTLCKVARQSCIENLGAEFNSLSASLKTVPSVQFPNGVATFVSENPSTAIEACRLSAQFSDAGKENGAIQCRAPGATFVLQGASTGQFSRSVAVIAVVSLFLTISLILVLAPAAIRIGLVDRPNERKRHHGNVPLVGGVSMCIAFMLSAFALVADTPLALLLCVIILAITGLLDDLKELSATRKLFAQILAVVLMIYLAGVEVSDLGNLFGNGSIPMGFWAIPFTVFGVVGVINATNMIDGLDGLAGGISIVAALWLLFAAFLCSKYVQMSLLAALAATIAGFLIFNFGHPWHRRALVFMGDTGSLFLGFVLAWFAVDLCQGGEKHFYPISAVWILGLPLLDTVSLMLRRAIKGISPFTADRQHVHHILLAAGFTQNAVVFVLVATSVLFGAVGIAGWYYAVPEYMLFWGYICLFGSYYLVMSNAWTVKKLLTR